MGDIYVATALETGAVELWTGDAALARCAEVPIVLIAAPST